MVAERVAQIVREVDTAGKSRQEKAGMVLPLLQRIQRELGYIPREAMAPVALAAGVTENHVYGVATFYAHFKFTPPGRHHVTVCCGTACHVRGSAKLVDDLRERLGVAPGQTAEDGSFSLETTACFGSCALAPVIVIDGKVQGRVTRGRLMKTLDALEKEDVTP